MRAALSVKVVQREESGMNNKKQRGTVKWFNDEKGFGFIQRRGQEDVFVHYSGIATDGHRTLVKDQVVEFYIEESHRTGRPNATMVTIVAPEDI